MGNKADTEDAQERAQRRLVKAQAKLAVAQEKHVRARERGTREIERARQRAEERLANAAERVERRSKAVAEAEAAVLALSAPEVPRMTPDGRVEMAAPTPDAAEQVIRRQESDAALAHPAEPIVGPPGVDGQVVPPLDSGDGANLHG